MSIMQRSRIHVSELFIPTLAVSVSIIITANPLDSITFGLVTLALQTLGLSLIRQFTPEIGPSLLTLIIAFLVSVVVVVEAQQLTLRFTSRGIPIWIPLCVSGVILVTRDKGSIRIRSPEAAANARLFGVSSFIVLLLSSRVHFWVAPFAVGGLCLAIFAGREVRSKLASPALLLLFASAVITGFVLRSSPPLLVSEEQVFYDMLSRSLAHFTWDTAIYSTTSPLNYHWLSYAFNGWIDRELGFDPYMLMSGIGPILFGILVIVAILKALKVERMTVNRLLALGVAIGTFTIRHSLGGGFGALHIFTSPATTLSLLFGAALLLMIVRHGDVQVRSRNVVLALLTYGMVGSYITTAIPVLSASILFLIFNLRPRDTKVDYAGDLVAIAVVLAVSAFALWRFTGFPFAETPDSARIGITPLFGFVEQLSEVQALHGSHRTLAKAGYFLGIAVIPILAILTSAHRYSGSFQRISLVTIVGGVVSVLVTQADSYGNNLPLLTGVLVFAIPMAAVKSVETAKLDTPFFSTVAVSALTWVLWLDQDMKRAQFGGITDIRFRLLGQSLPALLAGVLVGAMLLTGQLMRRYRSREVLFSRTVRRSLNFALVGVFTFGCLQGVSTWIEGYHYYSSRFDRWSHELAPNTAIQLVGEWLSENIPPTAVLAVDEADADIELQNLVRVSKRRLLIIGPELWAKDFRLDPGGPRLLQLQRLISAPSQLSLDALSSEGVTHIVSRRAISSERLGPFLGPPVFFNGDWSVYKLSADPSS